MLLKIWSIIIPRVPREFTLVETPLAAEQETGLTIHEPMKQELMKGVFVHKL